MLIFSWAISPSVTFFTVEMVPFGPSSPLFENPSMETSLPKKGRYQALGVFQKTQIQGQKHSQVAQWRPSGLSTEIPCQISAKCLFSGHMWVSLLCTYRCFPVLCTHSYFPVLCTHPLFPFLCTHSLSPILFTHGVFHPLLYTLMFLSLSPGHMSVFLNLVTPVFSPSSAVEACLTAPPKLCVSKEPPGRLFYSNL